MVIPLRGWSEVGGPEGRLHDLAANQALVDALRRTRRDHGFWSSLGGHVQSVSYDAPSAGGISSPSAVNYTARMALDTDYEFYASGAQGPTRGVAEDTERSPIVLTQNYMEDPDFDPLLPEESSFVSFHTNTGITVTRRTSVWSYPDYDDFIIYDYTFKNTGHVISNLTGQVVPNPEDFQQTLEEVYFAFHSAISVSTKSNINFHADLVGVAAGAFGAHALARAPVVDHAVHDHVRDVDALRPELARHRLRHLA